MTDDMKKKGAHVAARAAALVLALSAPSQALLAQSQQSFHNPVIHADMADPSVTRVGDTYYAAGTSSEWAPYYPLFKSKDLVNWKQVGHIFDEKPDWTYSSFWAPELFYHNGKLYCYYSARDSKTHISYVGVAIADKPGGKFKDYGPLVKYGIEAIDGYVFDDGGQLYISWKNFGAGAHPDRLLGCRLSADGLKLEGDPFIMIEDSEGIGMEGQCHFKSGEYYYTIYSANSCCGAASNYDVRVARSKTFAGPYEKYEGNPVLHGGDGDFKSCGHGTVVESKDGRMFYLCHAYLNGAGFYGGRQPILEELEMTPDHWVRFRTGDEAKVVQPVPFAGTRQKAVADFYDSFGGKRLKTDWTWYYSRSDIDATLKGGRLLLAGEPKNGNKWGTALCLRPLFTDYVCTARMDDGGGTLAGLTMYGDDKNFVALGVERSMLVLRQLRDGKVTDLFSAPHDDGAVYLKMEVRQGCMYSFAVSADGKAWRQVGDAPFDGSYLLRWDLVQRPGLLSCGDKAHPAVFDWFRMARMQ